MTDQPPRTGPFAEAEGRRTVGIVTICCFAFGFILLLGLYSLWASAARYGDNSEAAAFAVATIFPMCGIPYLLCIAGFCYGIGGLWELVFWNYPKMRDFWHD